MESVQKMNEDWLERYAELLECDPKPSSISVAIQDLLKEKERLKQQILNLKKETRSVKNNS